MNEIHKSQKGIWSQILFLNTVIAGVLKVTRKPMQLGIEELR